MDLKEKIMLGAVYCDFEPELIKAREDAKKITRLYNQTTDGDTKQRHLLLDTLFQTRGKVLEDKPLQKNG